MISANKSINDKFGCARELTERIRYTRADAAQMLSISLRQLDRLRTDGKIIGRVDGKRTYFDHDELVSYAKSCAPEGAA